VLWRIQVRVEGTLLNRSAAAITYQTECLTNLLPKAVEELLQKAMAQQVWRHWNAASFGVLLSLRVTAGESNLPFVAPSKSDQKTTDRPKTDSDIDIRI
jgi:hypothetical protein